MTYLHRTLIIPSGQVTALQNKLKTEDHPGLDGMFTTPMSASGNLPATHYVSSGHLSQAESDFLDANLPKPFLGNDDGEGPFAMFERIGLKIISPPM